MSKLSGSQAGLGTTMQDQLVRYFANLLEQKNRIAVSPLSSTLRLHLERAM